MWSLQTSESTLVMRFLDFLTGEMHPLAANPVLTIVPRFTINYTTLWAKAEVLGDTVLVLLNQGNWVNDYNQSHRWYLVEWKTGRVVHVSVQDLQQLFH